MSSVLKLAITLSLIFNSSGLVYSQASGEHSQVIYWTENGKAVEQLKKFLASSSSLGLRAADYEPDFLNKIVDSMPDPGGRINDQITQVAVKFFTDVVYGKRAGISFDGLHYKPDCVNIAGMITTSVADHSFPGLLDKLENKTGEYGSLKNMIPAYNDSLASATVSKRKAFFRKRIDDISRALNTLRWMACLLENNEYAVVVNVPSATLLVYHFNSIILESKVIVGKRSTRTPQFVSNLTDVTIYPFWHVPKSIATKELLPMIRQDIKYLENNNFQVLDSQGKIISPYLVDWQSLNENNFPYTLRQTTGCDNSLGLIKMNINHPNNIYLHDTPWKGLFESRNRFFSHGCIRVQKAKELAHIVLKENSIAVDTLRENENCVDQSPRVLPLSDRIPVLVLYNTAWYGMDKSVRFYPDIYSKFK